MPIPVSPGFLLYAQTLALDGVFIWWMSGHDIIFFDFSNEVFRTTPLPRLLENCDRSSTITSLNGHVALLAFSSFEINPKWYSELEIWVLLEFGVQESWTRVTTIGLPMDLKRRLGFWKGGSCSWRVVRGNWSCMILLQTQKELSNCWDEGIVLNCLHTPSLVAV
ncbi:hypothetical protein SLA2020_262050 [Shorea laevis]